MTYIIAQIIGFISLGISLIAYHRKEKKSIMTNLVICNSLKIIHYLLLEAYSGCITKIIAIIRDITIILQEKHPKLSSNIILLFFSILYVVAAIFTYQGILSIFSLVAALIYTIFIWNGDELKIKKTAFFCYFLWLVYNIYASSISEVISNILGIVSTYIAIKNTNRWYNIKGDGLIVIPTKTKSKR